MWEVLKIGAIVFAVAMAVFMLIDYIGNRSDDD